MKKLITGFNITLTILMVSLITLASLAAVEARADDCADIRTSYYSLIESHHQLIERNRQLEIVAMNALGQVEKFEKKANEYDYIVYGASISKGINCIYEDKDITCTQYWD